MKYQAAIQSLINRGYRLVNTKEETDLSIHAFLTELVDEGLGELEVSVVELTPDKALVRMVAADGFVRSEKPHCTAYRKPPKKRKAATQGKEPRMKPTALRGIVVPGKSSGKQRQTLNDKTHPPLSNACDRTKSGKIDWELCGVPPELENAAPLSLKLEATLDHFGITLTEFARIAKVDVKLVNRLYQGKVKRPRSSESKHRIETLLHSLWENDGETR